LYIQIIILAPERIQPPSVQIQIGGNYIGKGWLFIVRIVQNKRRLSTLTPDGIYCNH